METRKEVLAMIAPYKSLDEYLDAMEAKTEHHKEKLKEYQKFSRRGLALVKRLKAKHKKK
jgi:hypothetical protein